jgi:hypothetical protein
MICPNHNGPLCTTCRLGGLTRCPYDGKTALPLVENERPKVSRRVYPLTQVQLEALRRANDAEGWR